ncbi:hypothetical protein SAMN05216230_101382 [Pseudomonas soli]|uniref:Tail tape measure protein n=1 Tax=Pseudomonas soli TaxID=1306993 RepID=A0A1H9AEJ8_9PSED|nr:hypothetical protein SAMN05216230_101382 [Pseudomonas soli]
MANRSTTALGAVGVTVPEHAGSLEGLPGRTVPMRELGRTQRLAEVGGGGSTAPPPQGAMALQGEDTQAESLKVQQQQVGLLQQHKALLERSQGARSTQPGPELLPLVGQAARDVASSLLIAGGGYLAAKGVAQAQAAIGKARNGLVGSTDSNGQPGAAQGSASVRPGTLYLPALVIGSTDGAPGSEDYPLGADAMPAPLPRSDGPGRWAQALQAGKSATGMAGLDALTKLVFTATTASTPEQRGEGEGAAAGGFLGAVSGAILGAGLKLGAPTASMMLGFAGDKVGGVVGKELMARPDSAAHSASVAGVGNGQSTPSADAAPPSASSTSWGTLASALGIGVGAAAYKHRGRLRRPGRGVGLDEPYPLGADAGPSPSGINPPPGRWARLTGAFKAAGKLPWLEAGVKGAYTYATAKTPEEKGAGYGGAIGGAVGTVLGGMLLSGVVGPPVAMLIGNMVGDKIGGVIGGWAGKTFFSASDELRKSPRQAISLGDPRQITLAPKGEVLDGQVGTRIARQLLAPSQVAHSKPRAAVDARPAGGVEVPLAIGPGVLIGAPVGKYFSERAAEFKPQETSVPAGPLALPDAGPRPVHSQGLATQPVSQQLTFTANMPITVQGSVDAPNQLTQQLEEAVRRVMQDLQRQAYNAQLADHPNPF